MATPSSIFSQAVDDIFTAIVGEVETVTYNGTDIVADVTYGDSGDESGAVDDSATIVVKITDVASPAYRDTVVIGSSTWRVKKDGITGDGHSWSIPLTRQRRPVV